MIGSRDSRALNVRTAWKTVQATISSLDDMGLICTGLRLSWDMRLKYDISNPNPNPNSW